MALDPFQARVARVALGAAAAHGFALAGGNALAAHGLLSRPTEDVDLFTPQSGGPGRALDTVRAALEADGFTVQVSRSPTDHDGEFAQLQVSRGVRTTQLDLARDWRACELVTLEVGPVLHLEDAVGAKVTAMLGRGLARDYLDIGAALDRFGRGRLLELGFERDPGLRVADVAISMQRLDRLSDVTFERYGLPPAQVSALRARFADCPRDSDRDDVARTAHLRASTRGDQHQG
jgi:hypothetical protein